MSDVKKIATRETYGKTLVELGAEMPNLVVLDADLAGATKTGVFKKAYPDRHIDCGIAEGNMMSIAAGLAAAGMVPFASTFAMFAAGRAYEIVRNSIAHTKANVKVCATHGGITVGEDGATHQTFEDIALMRVLPDMKVIVPADAVSTKILMKQEFDTDGPAYFRLGRSGVPEIYIEGSDAASQLKVGKAYEIMEGNDVAIIANGIMVAAAMEAAMELRERGVKARVIDMHTVKPIDEDAIIRAAEECGHIVTAEEHSVIGGLGSAVAEVTAQKCPCRITMVGQHDCFGESGKPAELLKKYGMTAEDIVKAALQ